MPDPDQSKPGEASQPKPERKEVKAEFLTLVVTLAGQASIQMGLVPNPITKKIVRDLKQARFAIDMLTVLEQKTKGNLTPEEQKVLSHVLADLRVRFVQATNG